jgi:hypothetical protein
MPGNSAFAQWRYSAFAQWRYSAFPVSFLGWRR